MTGNGRRVAVTGLGMVTPIGNDVVSTWDGLMAGRGGAAGITAFDATGFPVRIAAEVKDFDIDVIDDRKLLKSANRYQRFGLAAAVEAIITEAIFGWPGIGRLYITALGNIDYTVVMAIVMVIGIGIVVMNIIADILYGVMDPRVRYD